MKIIASALYKTYENMIRNYYHYHTKVITPFFESIFEPIHDEVVHFIKKEKRKDDIVSFRILSNDLDFVLKENDDYLIKVIPVSLHESLVQYSTYVTLSQIKEFYEKVGVDFLKLEQSVKNMIQVVLETKNIYESSERIFSTLKKSLIEEFSINKENFSHIEFKDDKITIYLMDGNRINL